MGMRLACSFARSRVLTRRYCPNMQQPEWPFDFAVRAAGPDSLALAALKLSAYGLKDPNPVNQMVYDGTFDLMANLVEIGRQAQGPGGTWLDVLDRIVEANYSSIRYRRFVEVDWEDDPAFIALAVLRNIARRAKLPSQRFQVGLFGLNSAAPTDLAPAAAGR
jgi:hypothetical protein